MLFAIRHPAVLLGLLIGFCLGCLLRVALSRLLLRGRPTLRVVGRNGPLRGIMSPQAWLDPFGAVAAILSGVGWSPRQESVTRGKRHQVWFLVVAALVAHAVVAAAGIVVLRLVHGRVAFLSLDSTVSVLHGSVFIGDTAQQIATGVVIESIGCGLLALVPIPPLELGVAVWSTFPKSAGARRLAYRVLEEQWGVAVLLVLLLLPLAGEQPALLALIGSIGDRILAAFS